MIAAFTGLAIAVGLVVTTVTEDVNPLRTLGGLGTVALAIGLAYLAEKFGV